MNKNQKILTLSALAFFLASVLFAPWISLGNPRTVTHSPLFMPPDRVSLQWQVLFCEWIAIGILHAGLWFLIKGMEIKFTRAMIMPAIIAILVLILLGAAIWEILKRAGFASS